MNTNQNPNSNEILFYWVVGVVIIASVYFLGRFIQDVTQNPRFIGFLIAAFILGSIIPIGLGYLVIERPWRD